MGGAGADFESAVSIFGLTPWEYPVFGRIGSSLDLAKSSIYTRCARAHAHTHLATVMRKLCVLFFRCKPKLGRDLCSLAMHTCVQGGHAV